MFMHYFWLVETKPMWVFDYIIKTNLLHRNDYIIFSFSNQSVCILILSSHKLDLKIMATFVIEVCFK